MPETRGITIEFYGKDLNLQNTIKDINNGLKATKTQLTDFKNQLKIDPKNLDALKGKFRMLQQEETLLQQKAEYFRKELSKLDESEVGKEKWNGLDEQLKKTQKQILAVQNQLEKMGDVDSMTEVTTEAEKMGDSFKEASDGALKFGDVLKANVIGDLIVNGIKAIANELKQLGSELHQWANDYRELEVYEKQFESNLKNTADASDEQIASLKKLAKQKERTGVVSSKAITSAYQELATYVESAEAVEGLTDALTDMAAQQYGVDATEESVRNLATTLGKALANGDYSGLTRLGYGFDEAQKYVMKYGTELERVAVLNDVIESSIGGVNEALAQTDAGQIFQVKTYFDDVKKTIGEVISEIEVGFIQGVMPELQPFIDDFLKWIIDHKDEIIDTVKNTAEWLTSDDMKQFYSDVADLVLDIGKILEDIVKIGDAIGLWEDIFNVVKAIISGIKELFDGIARDVESIRSGGLGFGTLSFGGAGASSFVPRAAIMQSGGMMSGGITLNNTFTINNGNDIDESVVTQWADIMTERINENLGRMV